MHCRTEEDRGLDEKKRETDGKKNDIPFHIHRNCMYQ